MKHAAATTSADNKTLQFLLWLLYIASKVRQFPQTPMFASRLYGYSPPYDGWYILSRTLVLEFQTIKFSVLLLAIISN